jgi:hypothetical protein
VKSSVVFKEIREFLKNLQEAALKMQEYCEFPRTVEGNFRGP